MKKRGAGKIWEALLSAAQRAGPVFFLRERFFFEIFDFFLKKTVKFSHSVADTIREELWAHNLLSK